jgi:hypothetical protein
MTEKGIDLLRKLSDGKKLYEYKIGIKRPTTTYKLENKTIHPSVVKTLFNGNYLMRGSSKRVANGWATEICLID